MIGLLCFWLLTVLYRWFPSILQVLTPRVDRSVTQLSATWSQAGAT
jgi:hypothetical protein